MVSILFVVTHATDNPTKAVFPFELAAVAADSGHDAHIALVGDGVLLMNPSIADRLQGLGTASFKQALAEVNKREIPIYACGTCMETRGVTEADLKTLGAFRMNKGVFIELSVTSDKVLTF
jgi:predicted peroxiredoxin